MATGAPWSSPDEEPELDDDEELGELGGGGGVGAFLLFFLDFFLGFDAFSWGWVGVGAAVFFFFSTKKSLGEIERVGE